MSLRVLVVDDMVMYRTVVSGALSSIPGVEVVGTASNGKIALDKIASLRPDLVSLDIEMPEMNGIAVLEAMKSSKMDTGVVVLSALTRKGGELTVRALELGAFDFITKPSGNTADQSVAIIKDAFLLIIKAFSSRLEIRSILKGKPNVSPVSAPTLQSSAAIGNASSESVEHRMSKLVQPVRAEMVLIGVSTGGPVALAEVLSNLPRDFPLPILIVQHMPPLFTESLANSLNAKSAIEVKEASDGDEIKRGVAYIAPGGKHMKIIAKTNGEKMIRITEDPPENNCRPAVDYLFRSVAHTFPGKALAVIMTGMGNDGTLGLKLLKRHGCLSIAQDEQSCVVFGMPKEAITAGVVDRVVPLSSIANEICMSAKALRV